MEYENLDNCIFCESPEIISFDKKHFLYQCNNCGLIFDNPRPTPKEIEIFYSDVSKYDSWLEHLQSREIMWKERLDRIAKIKNKGKLLDIGAGIGQFLELAKKNYEVVGTEISDSAIDIAKRVYDIDLLKGDIDNISFSNNEFDIITIFHVLEHVHDPQSLIKKSQELLTQEGLLVIAVPNDVISYKAIVKSLIAFLKLEKFKKFGKFGLPKIELDGSLPEIHISHFRPFVLRNGLQNMGFTILEESIDRAYAEEGLLKGIKDIEYSIFLVIHRLFKINMYDTIWITARRN